MTNEEITREIEVVFEEMAKDGAIALGRLEPLYADDVVFIDPLQTLHGRDAFMAMNRRLMSGAREIGFEIQEHAAHGDNIFLTWKMRYAPKWGPLVELDGVTHLRRKDGRIVHHRDYWDLLGSLMAKIPIVGNLYRAFTAKLA